MKRDIVIARPGDESAFIEEAVRLGWKRLLILYEEQDARSLAEEVSSERIEVTTGVLLSKGPVPKWVQRFSEVAVLGTMISSVPKGVTLLCDNEYDDAKDYTHQRRSGVSYVMMAVCKEKGVKLAAGVSGMVKMSQRRTSQVLGRMMQNMKLAAKKQVSYELVSMARRPEEMRSRRDVKALQRVLG